MTDREKVIKALECCASMNGSACRECPYSSECVAGEVTYQTGTAHLAADALALLKKQEAVEPMIKTSHDGKGSWWYICGSCNTAVNQKDKYCRECGRKLKWE